MTDIVDALEVADPKNAFADLRDSVTRSTTEDLKAELGRLLGFTAENLLRLAVVVTELEQRGEDLSDLKLGILPILRDVAAGHLAAEAVVAFAGRRSVLQSLMGMPLGQQRRLVAGELIEVIDPEHPDQVSSLTLSELPSASLGLVFANGEIRDPAKQRLAIRRRQKLTPKPSLRNFRPEYDQKAGAMRVGRMNVPVADLVRELANASGPDRPPSDIPEEYDIVRVRLTHDEYRAFQEKCKLAALPDWEMVRKAMRAFGLL